VIQREISRALVLNLLWQTQRCSSTAQDYFALDRAFSLIEGHPPLDKQWKRRVENLPKPNRVPRIYYEPEVGAMVDDIEAALVQIKASRKSPLAL